MHATLDWHMDTEFLPAPLLTQDTISPAGTHWVCIRVIEHPKIGLCGTLTNGRRLGERASVSCATCLELAPEHGAVCPTCAAWVAHGA